MRSENLITLEEAQRKPYLEPLELREFLAREIPPRGVVLDPILPEQGLVMLYAPRGVGKTHVALGMAYAVASGSPFLSWNAPVPRSVLYVDGEMPATSMQERLAGIVTASDKEPKEGMFRLLTPDLLEVPMPDLSRRDGQALLMPHLENVKLLVLDNLSTLCRRGRENEAESWIVVQEWLLELRRKGMSVLFIHHAGKGGSQRGTSKREDVLDTVIALKRPDDYLPDEGARFEVHIEKARGLTGDDVKPFEARLEVRQKQSLWTTRDLENVREDRVAELSREGLSVRDIAEETGIPKSTVSRIQKKLRAEGVIH
ncbi:MAG: RNA polymerase subunit sigma-70 [Hyphomicrobiales bacterium]|nr:MAG: RNA polymerase subunit sigma-70 [Hyphomicrobiales bacterium]